MNITFLIGNGFDRNLGLDTTYSDFVKVYKTLLSDSKHVNSFRNYIKENEKLWSKAEEALGQYTQQLEKGQGSIFSECQADFCANLAQYLKQQEARIDYAANKEQIKLAFQRFRNLSEPFPSSEKAEIDAIYKSYSKENIGFNFIDYNYTYTVDHCIEIIQAIPGILGSHSYYMTTFKHLVGKICHVHGTVDGQMVFGVNDDSQISNLDVFDGTDGDLSKALLIKKSANAFYREDTDAKAYKILKDSSILYIYGMALGITDKLWWQRVCSWLVQDQAHHVILYQYEMPAESVIPYQKYQFERSAKRHLWELGGLAEENWASVQNRIHVTGYNIFSPIQNIATPLSDDTDISSSGENELVATV